MTRQDIVNEIKEKTANFDASGYKGFLAVQVTLSDLNEPFYVEIKNGRLSIEPYEYADRQANLLISSDNFLKLINGKINPVLAFATGKLKIKGDVGKATELAEMLNKS